MERYLDEHAPEIFELTERRASTSTPSSSISRIPFGKYDQVFVPEFNSGAMENVGCVTYNECVPVPRPADRQPAPRSRRDVPARAGAHVVRRPGDDALVERPVAERELRDLHLLPRADRGDAFRQRLAGLQLRHQALGLPAGPAAHHPPDRRRRPTTPRRLPQLRRHHLRQGRVGPQAARQVHRPGRLPRRHAALLPRATATPTRRSPTSSPASSRPAAATSLAGPQAWLRTASLNTLAAQWQAKGRTADRARHRADSARRVPHCCGRTRSRSRWPRARRPARDRDLPAWHRWTADTELPAHGRRAAPNLVFPNHGDHAYAKIALDPVLARLRA